jgi:tripeptide aminopeptidase
MPITSRTGNSEVSTIQQEIVRLAARAEIKSACAWLRAQEPQFAHWQMQVAEIPAPPFGEAARAHWLAERFREFDLEDVHIDEAGNVLGMRPGVVGGQYVSLSAHIDTVFPTNTPLNIRQEGTRLFGPGVSDNGAGITALLAIASALQVCKVQHPLPILFVGNVGEEGEGDLRGMRHLFSEGQHGDGIISSLIIDGAGSDTIVAEALGSRRFEVIVRGPGGHSWSDFGTPNPIVVLAHAIQAFSQTPVPASPKTTFNIGVIRGGTSVNSIPESVSMRVDIRSTSMAEMERLEVNLRYAIDAGIEEAQSHARGGTQKHAHKLSAEVIAIGNRPAGELDSNARIVRIIRAIDAHLGNGSQIQRASTDANVPLSLGREAIAIGGGGTGGGAHTLQEWFDCNGRELGLKRILLCLLALTGTSE